ncbi:hypothetical protein HII36_28930 [Nonomuraea sp. NN258]|uniref:DUF6113 family protein n=1 Tax=Nonomuraea antri TaxID=2730852 RepID=UPI001568C0A5|nr:DUF6113 family protein [Nonomuraea antri]NRQ35828.1 hypothetical protein [Nonomuraea antri]
MEHRSHAESALGGAAYGMLFVLGVVMGVVGGFTHLLGWLAWCWVLGLFAVCLGAGKLLRSRLGAAATGAGWLVMSMLFTLPMEAGDIVVTDSAAGYTYLYGGMAALVVAFFLAPSSGGSWLMRGYPPENQT